MQDNAKIYTAKATKFFLESHGIWTIEFPPYLPDLNPIEHLWYVLKRKLHKPYPEFDTIREGEEEWKRFCEGLKEARLAIPNSLIRRLIYSIPNRLTTARRANSSQPEF